MDEQEILEQLDIIIESLTERGDCYTALDLAYELRDDLVETFGVDTD